MLETAFIRAGWSYDPFEEPVVEDSDSDAAPVCLACDGQIDDDGFCRSCAEYVL